MANKNTQASSKKEFNKDILDYIALGTALGGAGIVGVPTDPVSAISTGGLIKAGREVSDWISAGSADAQQTKRSDNRAAKDNAAYTIYDNAGRGYTFDFTTGNSEGVKDKKTAAVLEYLVKNGALPSTAEQVRMPGDGNFKRAVVNARNMLAEMGLSEEYFRNQLLASGQNVYDSNGKDITSTFYNSDGTLKKEYQEAVDKISNASENAEQTAYDRYWNDLYSRNEGTLGAEAYDQMVAAERAAGQNAIDLADAQAQQLGMAQAASVKQITDSLKAERMAKLRAGMSESQIASQDMQTLLANTNALNEQIAAQNLAAMQGQQQVNNAQNTAYVNWLNTMNQTATPASAFAAADAGNPDLLARQYAARTGVTYQKAYETVTGQKKQQ